MFLRKKIAEKIDWLGVILILTAFTLSSFGVIESNKLLYIGLNIIGSACIAGVSYKKRDFQPMTLNSIWMLVAIIALIRALTD